MKYVLFVGLVSSCALCAVSVGAGAKIGGERQNLLNGAVGKIYEISDSASVAEAKPEGSLERSDESLKHFGLRKKGSLSPSGARKLTSSR